MMLKKKMLKMEKHLEKKNHEHAMAVDHSRKANSEKVQSSIDLDLMEGDAENERNVREGAMRDMMGTLHTKRNAIQRRADFERWRHEVALEAANEAFQGSAGRLRKLYAVEKLAGNCLQKITFEQVEKSQATEDGFQKIREVTGLNDVMDIVHKFLNRDVEEAETKLTHDLQEYTSSLQALENTTVTFEHLKGWARRLHRSLAPLEEPLPLDTEQQLVAYSRQLRGTVDRFLKLVTQTEGKKKPRAPDRDQHELSPRSTT